MEKYVNLNAFYAHAFIICACVNSLPFGPGSSEEVLAKDFANKNGSAFTGNLSGTIPTTDESKDILPEKSLDKTKEKQAENFPPGGRQNPTVILIPEILTFFDTLLFWDSLVCNTEGLCDDGYRVVHPITCSPLQCGECSCESCGQHRDCCVDKVQELMIPSSANKQAYLSCQPASPMPSGNDDSWYYFINKCPEYYKNETVKERCESTTADVRHLSEVFQSLPVVSKITQMNYKNHYCAECHSDQEAVEHWDPQITCSSFVDIDKIRSKSDVFDLVLKNEGCHLELTPPSGIHYYECESRYRVIGECNVTGEWTIYDETLAKGCNAYKHVVSSKWGKYHNIFCAMCNGVSYASILKLFKEGYRCYSPTVVDTEVFPSFSMLFNLHQHSPSTVSSLSTGWKECLEHQVHDPHSDTCREFVCSKGRIHYNHSCVHVHKTAANMGYNVHYFLQPEPSPYQLSQSYEDIWYSYFEDLLHSLPSLLALSPIYAYAEMKVCYQMIEENCHDPVTLVHWLQVEYRTVVGENLSPDEVEHTLLTLSNSSWQFEDTVWRAREGIFSDQGGDREIQCVTFGQALELEETEGEQKSLYNGYTSGPSLYIRVSTLSGCNRIELSETEYTMDGSSGDIRLAWSNETLSKTDYIVLNDTVQICVNYSGFYHTSSMAATRVNHRVSSRRDKVESWLTLVTLTLSLAGLALTFFLSLFTKIRSTLPGKITIVLVFTLFTAQLLFLVSGYARGKLWPCRLLGLAVHYFWLSVFFWKNLAAYHMYVVFAKPFKHTNDNQPRTLLKYSLYGYGVPGVIIGSYILIRSLLSGSENIGYSDQSCFLTRPMDIGLAFALPVGIVLLTNTFFFGGAVHEIRKMSEMEKNTNKTNSKHSALYMKMSLVLGFSWAVGFAANIVNEPYLWYAFIVLNGGTGILIFVSQVCNAQLLTCLLRGPMMSQTPSTQPTLDTTDKATKCTAIPQ